jgi:hypothetical protein
VRRTGVVPILPGGSGSTYGFSDFSQGAALAAAARASLVVQSEVLPYKYVSVEGPVEIVETNVAEEQRAIAVRYLGEKLGARYLASKAFDLSDEVLLLLHPERWWSVDFSQASLN